MLVKNHLGIYQSDLLLAVRGLLHGFSGRPLGDMRLSSPRKIFLQKLGDFSTARLVRPQQVHQAYIHKVRQSDLGKLMVGADGLVFRPRQNEKNMPILSILAGDCVPLLFVDPLARVVGVAHAGWRGTLAGIVKEIVVQMQALGAKAKDILVVIGPRIGMCCYNVGQEEAIKFRQVFGNTPKVASRINGSWHLDLGFANFLALTKMGILAKNIDLSTRCVSCQHRDFFSLRRDGKSGFGEFMGVIGFIPNKHELNHRPI